MKKWYRVFIAACAAVLSAGVSDDVSAETDVEQAEFEESSRYDPRFYEQPEEIFAQGQSRAAALTLEDAVVEGLLNFTDKIDISQFHLKEDSVFETYMQILNSHPEIFYAASGCGWITNGAGDVFAITPQYLMEKDEAEQIGLKMEAAADEALSYVTPDMEDYEKALVIHDWLAVYCEYDYDRLNENKVPDESHQSYGALVQKTAVCDGYAKAYQYLLNKLSIPCITVSSASMNHAWNMIEIDGKYYHVDVTWDDPTRDTIGRVMHTHFLLSDEGIRKAEHDGWVTTLKAEDDSYESAYWTDSISSVIPYNGSWFYVDDAQRKLYKTDNLLQGRKQEMFAFDGWTIGSSIWQGTYSFLQTYGGELIFNGPEQIYSMPFSTEEVKTLYKPAEPSAEQKIFGFKLADETMYYAIQSSPNLEQAQAAYIKTAPLPGNYIKGTITITGTPRYQETLTAAAVPENENAGTLSYSWYRDGVQISGETTQTYRITESDIGKKISVRAVMEDFKGALTQETAVIQKAIPSKPAEEPALNGVYGTALSSLSLPDGYAWKNPNTRIEALGDLIYPVTYCPDSRLYDVLDNLTVKVTVSCVNHVWNSGETIKEATCTEPGMKKLTCTVCQETKMQETAAVGHQNTELRNQAQAKPGKTGYTGDLYCKDCGILITAGQVIPALAQDHVPGSDSSDKKPDDDTDNSNNQPTEQPNDKPEQNKLPKKGDTITQGKAKYKVTKAGRKNGTVEFVKTASTSKSISIPKTIKKDGIVYKVTSIAAKAFKDNKKMNSITIGENIEKIGSSAFEGCKNLKNIIIKSKKLKTIGKNAIKNIDKKAQIKCPAKKAKDYRKLFGSRTGYKKTMKMK